MKPKLWLVGVMVGIAMLQGGVVHAKKTEVIVKAENKDDFAAVVAAVRQQMQPGGRYEFTSSGERQKIDENFTEMQALFDKYGTLAQMDQAAKIQLFNDQEKVNAILTHRDDKRLVCESVAPTGSNIPRTTCRSYREVELERHHAQDFQRQLLQLNQSSGRSLPGAGSGGH